MFVARQRLWLLLIAAVFLSGAVAAALTRIPWCDEAWFACAGYHLAAHGRLATPIVVPAADDPKTLGLARHTYWVPPLDPVFQAFWYSIFGFSLFALRSVSMLWGLVALFAWFAILRELAGNARTAVLGTALLATNFLFILRAADGRMDMMSAALGFAALAVYLAWRERSLAAAVAGGHSLVVLSGLTHPMGGLLSLAGVIFVMLYYDRRALGWRHAAWAALPYAAGAVGWGLHIAEDPRLFLTQFGGNTEGRFVGLWNPARAMWREAVDRYLPAFGWQAGAPRAAKIKLLVLVGYAAGLAGVLAGADLRRSRGVRALTALTAINLVLLTFLDSSKAPAYLVYSIPFLSAVLAVWASARLARWPAAAALAAFIILQFAGISNVVIGDRYVRSYKPAVAYLETHGGVAAGIVGEPEFGFALGFDGQVMDDRRLGYYTHAQPHFLVVGEDYTRSWETFRRTRPEIAQYVDGLLANDYRRVFVNDSYTIWEAK